MNHTITFLAVCGSEKQRFFSVVDRPIFGRHRGRVEQNCSSENRRFFGHGLLYKKSEIGKFGDFFFCRRPTDFRPAPGRVEQNF